MKYKSQYSFLLMLFMGLVNWGYAQKCTPVSDAERQALIDLFTATSGKEWRDNSNWGSKTDVCDWYGVTVTRGEVTGIQLSGNNLRGQLPQSIENLRSLEFLVLDENALSGELPKGIENLGNLNALIINKNHISGELPDFTLTRNLSDLEIADNAYTFSDLEKLNKYLESTLRNYRYFPQKLVDKERVARVREGDEFVLTTSLDSKNNRYQWFKDGKELRGATDPIFKLSTFSKYDFGNYYVQVTNSNVPNLTLTSYSTNASPSSEPNDFCLLDWDSIRVIDLTPQGPNVNWYLEETGGDPLPDDYDVEDYIIDFNDSMWWEDDGGARNLAIIYINRNTPDGDIDQYFSVNVSPLPTVDNLLADNDGNPIYWYTSPFGGNPLPGNYPLQDGAFYYASSCKDITNERDCPCYLEVQVHLGVLVPTGDPIQYFCKGQTLSDIVVEIEPSNDVLWYAQDIGGNPLNPSMPVDHGVTYYASQINPQGEESDLRLAVTTFFTVVPAPSAPSPQSFFAYDNPTVGHLSATGFGEIKWYGQAEGGYQYNSLELLVDGQIYYAEDVPGECPSSRTPVLVHVSDEDPPGLVGCDLFKPELGTRFAINAWVNEREVSPEVIDQVEFNNSPASEAFVGLLNHLVNRYRTEDPKYHDFPDVYTPQFTAEEEPFDLDIILPYLKGRAVHEKVLKVHDFKGEKDTYGRSVGFSFYLTESKEYKFKYISPKIHRLVHLYNGNVMEIGPESYPIFDNLGTIEIEFTNVMVNASGEFLITSNFSQTDTPAYSEQNVLGTLSDNGVLPVATFYKYNEIANQQSVTYEYAQVRIEFIDPDGNPLTSETVELIPQGEIIDDWQKVASDFRIPHNAGQMVITLLNKSDSRICYFDDLRIFPFEGNMKSFVYHPETQRLMAELDENNYATFYEYDKEGGLVRVKKETERGIFTIQESRSGNIKR